MCRNIIMFMFLVIGLCVLGWLIQRSGAIPLVYKGIRGIELVQKMEANINNINGVHFSIKFKANSADGPIDGIIKFWGQRDGKMRLEVTSESASLNGTIIIADGQQILVYKPNEKLVVIAGKGQYQALLAELPGLGEMLYLLRQIFARGFEGVSADNLGTEQINGRQAYKVQVGYKTPADLTTELKNVTTIFWIDVESFLPQQLEIMVQKDGLTADALITATSDIITNQPIDPGTFIFEPPAGTKVRNIPE